MVRGMLEDWRKPASLTPLSYFPGQHTRNREIGQKCLRMRNNTYTKIALT